MGLHNQCTDHAGIQWEVRCIAGKVWVRHQVAAGGGWTQYVNIQGGTPAGNFDTVSIAYNTDAGPAGGRMEVLAEHSAYQVLYRNYMNAAGVWQTFIPA